MFNSLKSALAALAGVFTLGTCAGCATAPYIPGSKTVVAVQEECSNRPVDQTVYCLTGVYDGLQFALAEERAAGTLSPEVVSRIDQSINLLGPRVITVKETFATKVKWEAKLETLKPLAEGCYDLASKRENAADGTLTACLMEIGYLAVSGTLSEITAEATADWGALEPQLREFIKLGKKETE